MHQQTFDSEGNYASRLDDTAITYHFRYNGDCSGDVEVEVYYKGETDPYRIFSLPYKTMLGFIASTQQDEAVSRLEQMSPQEFARRFVSWSGEDK